MEEHRLSRKKLYSHSTGQQSDQPTSEMLKGLELFRDQNINKREDVPPSLETSKQIKIFFTRRDMMKKH